jgi:hypothetical protein
MSLSASIRCCLFTIRKRKLIILSLVTLASRKQFFSAPQLRSALSERKKEGDFPTLEEAIVLLNGLAKGKNGNPNFRYILELKSYNANMATNYDRWGAV